MGSDYFANPAPDCWVIAWAAMVVVIVVCLLGFCAMLWAVQKERKHMEATLREVRRDLDTYTGTFTGGR